MIESIQTAIASQDVMEKETASTTEAVSVRVVQGTGTEAEQLRWQRWTRRFGYAGFHADPYWLTVLERSQRHVPYMLEATRGQSLVGLLPLAYVSSLLFGKFLVSLPYLNSAGVLAEDADTAGALISQAADLAETLNVRYLELRHEQEIPHPRLTQTVSSKVHMRLPLPATADELMTRFRAKLRSQVKRALQHGLTAQWGRHDLLDDFYQVFAINMRDLGTPVFGRNLFAEILAHCDGREIPAEPGTSSLTRGLAEICVVYREKLPVAGALLLHGPGTTEVPSASSLRKYNHLNCNMLMYWYLLERAILRGQTEFDFGRSTQGSGTFHFKEQWGAQPHPAIWQYYVRQGTVGDARPDNPKYQLMIRTWQKLPVWLSRLIGPGIVRGVP